MGKDFPATLGPWWGAILGNLNLSTSHADFKKYGKWRKSTWKKHAAGGPGWGVVGWMVGWLEGWVL